MLAVKRQGRDLWHGRSGCDSFRLTEEKVECVWRPMEEARPEDVPAEVLALLDTEA